MPSSVRTRTRVASACVRGTGSHAGRNGGWSGSLSRSVSTAVIFIAPLIPPGASVRACRLVPGALAKLGQRCQNTLESKAGGVRASGVDLSGSGAKLTGTSADRIACRHYCARYRVRRGGLRSEPPPSPSHAALATSHRGLRRRRAPAEGNAMEYAQVRSKPASAMARYRLVLFAVLAAIAMTLGA